MPTLFANSTDYVIASQCRHLFDCGGENVVGVVARLTARSATSTLQSVDAYLISSTMEFL